VKEKDRKEMSNEEAIKAAMDLPLETTKEYATRLLKDGNFAMAQKKSQPNLYDAGRRDQVKLRLRDDNIHDTLQAVKRGWDAPQIFSEKVLVARGKFSPEVCKLWYPTDYTGATIYDLAKLKAENPAEYEQLRTAAASYGIIAPIQESAEPLPAEPGELQQVPAELAELLNIDPATKLTKEGMDRAITAYATVKAERIVAEQAQAPVSVGAE
jgi:hypothetical protein